MGPVRHNGNQPRFFFVTMSSAARTLVGRCATIVALMTCCAAASAQSRLPLQIEIEQSSHVSRTCGPVRLSLRIEWGSPTIFRGALDIDVRDSLGELLDGLLEELLEEEQQSQQQQPA